MTPVHVGVAAVALALAGATASGGPSHARVSLSASPVRVTITGSGTAHIHVTNAGSRRVDVEVRRAGFTLDLHGRPRIVGHSRRASASAWLSVHPRRLILRPRADASLSVTSTLPRHAQPGDHAALVVLMTRPISRTARLAVRMRLGIVVVVRAPGTIVRRLVLGPVRVRRTRHARLVQLFVANRGNVGERLHPGSVQLLLRHAGRTFASLPFGDRELLPQTRALLQTRYRGRARGRVTVLVELRGRALGHVFHVRF